MKLALPEWVDLACPTCGGKFKAECKQLTGCETLGCPYCLHSAPLVGYFDPDLRRQIYHSVRSHLEQRLYDEQQLNRADYFEDERNLL